MPEQVGIFLLFIAFVVFNLIARAVNRRRQREAAETERQPPPPRAPVALPLPPRAVIRPPSVEESAPRPPVVARPPSVRRKRPGRGRRRLELHGGGLRRAIVLMTVLGPPRALEHEEKGG